LDLTVDFEGRTLGGSITHDLFTVSPTDKVVLDIWDMDIQSVDFMPVNSA